MIFRNGHISGFVDELVDSLQDVDHAALLSEYETEASFGSTNENNIGIPTAVVFLSDTSDEEALFGIQSEAAYDVALSIIEKMNTDLGLGLTFYPAIKLSEEADNLAYPGSFVLDMDGAFTSKTFYGALPGGGYGDISEEHSYARYGVSVGAEDASGNLIAGLSKNTLDTLIEGLIDTSSVLTIVIPHRLNSSTIRGSESKWTSMSGIHPALSSVKSYYSLLPVHALWVGALETLDVDVYSLIANSRLWAEHQTVLASYDDITFASIVPVLKHLVGSMLGLLPLGVSSLSSMVGASPQSSCASVGCILTGGDGDCCEDTLPITYSGYFNSYPELAYIYEEGDCGDVIEGDIGYSPNSTNPMNFMFKTSIGPLIVYSEDQIAKIRGGFATEGSVLHSIAGSLPSYVSFVDYADNYCDNLGGSTRTGGRNLRFKVLKNKGKDLKETAEKFTKIKERINSLCNYITTK